MLDPNVVNLDHPSSSRSAILDIALQIGLVVLLVYACSRIIVPFVGILVWSGILAVMLYPLHLRLAAHLGNRWSALLIGLAGIAVMLVAMVTVVASLASYMYSLLVGLHNQSLALPAPPAWLGDLPLVGPKLAKSWALVATNLPAALVEYGEVLKAPAAQVVSSAGGLAAGQLSFVLSFGIAAVLLAYRPGASDFARRLLGLLSGHEARGTHLVTLTAVTIRGVAIGVVGVAVIQSLLLAIGFFAIGLPAAGFWTVLLLLLCIVQVPAVIVTLPIIAYVFVTEATQPALIFLVWTLIAGLSDNVLKPLMLGRGMEVPMPVILIGVIGGMIVDGLLGLFVGPVVLAVGYVLLLEWMQQRRGQTMPQIDGRTP